MKPYERRACGKTVYYKVALWDAIAACWRDGKKAFDSEAAATDSVPDGTRCRISRIDDGQRADLEPCTK